MNEAQDKPKKKWYKRQPNRFDRFALVCFVCIVCAIAYIVLASKGLVDPSKESVYYEKSKIDLQNAVHIYQSDHNGSLPTLSGTYTNADCSTCNVINISALIAANGGTLPEPPTNLNLSTSGTDNCGGDVSLGCEKGRSYIWIVNTDGTVFSYCAGAECTTNNSGYQDVWP